MDQNEVIEIARTIRDAAARLKGKDVAPTGMKARVVDFLSSVGGKRNSFVREAQAVEGGPAWQFSQLLSLIDAFIAHAEAGLISAVGPERQAELDVVSDLLDQANSLLSDKKVHPAAPIVLIGATLEEFLRTWVEAEGLSVGNRKPSLDAYSQILKDADLISKQDSKDLTAWGGLRNHAAHGEWSEVSDPQRAKLMLEGVNLFMRKHAPTSQKIPAPR